MTLTGRTALVTGGAAGIGRAVAVALARAGADVVVTHRSHDPAGVVAEIRALGRTAEAHALDATDPAAVRTVVDRVSSVFDGRIDVLVNNAGGLIGRVPVAQMSIEHWRAVIDLNLTSAFVVTQAVLPVMPYGGRIVTIGSVAGQDGGGPGAVAYAAAKAGVDGLTRALAKDLGRRGITVNAVAPGFIGDTAFHEQHTAPEAQRAAVAATLVGRAGTPADVAAAVLYLASDPGFVTGAVLDLNGGSHLR